MSSLISWCADCGAEAVFDAVPDALGEFVCRRCDAAAFAGEVVIHAPLPQAAVA
ncbi:MAG: hypothetical protein ACRDVZ_00010 [Jiangellaceae bacterium]